MAEQPSQLSQIILSHGDSQRALNEVSVALLGCFFPLPSLSFAFCASASNFFRQRSS